MHHVKYGHRNDLIKSLKSLGIVFKLNFDSDWLVADTLNKKVNLNQLKIAKGLVPNVIGMTAKDAVYLLENVGMIVRIRGYGSVKNQSISAGNLVFKGGLIQLQLQ